MEPTKTPRVLSGRYELSHLVARGGMAEVYRAHDRMLDRPVALKVLFPELSIDRSFVERFRREAQAAANLSHPNIVPVFDWGEDGGTYFIVMEFIDGRPLSSILRTAGPLHPDRAADIGADVAAALDYAHRHQVVHRDVKPGNVLITEEGVVKVTDFGIARAVNTEESLTQTGAVMGTATYFSPEQAEGLGVDHRSDIYSLGVVLFEMVTGRPPFLGESPVSVASKHVRETPPTPREINPAVPPDFEAIILKCMAKNPDYRYASGNDLRVDLLRFREGRAVSAPPVTGVMAGTTGVMGATDVLGPRTGVLPMTEAATEEDEPKSRTGWYIALLVLLLAGLAVVVLFLGNSLGWWKLGSSTPSFTLHDVYGQSVTQAEFELVAEGLKVKTAIDHSSTASTTTVLRTDPARGSTVHKGQTITLITGAGPKNTQITVPDETNQSVAIARADLEGKGLQVSVQNSTSCTQVNIVCSQNPQHGTKVGKGAVVTLYTAPSTVAVPPVSGFTVSGACSALVSAHLLCGSVSYQSSSQGQGTVIATTPPIGSQVNQGTTVNLTVSSGPPPSSTTTSTTTTSTTQPGGTSSTTAP